MSAREIGENIKVNSYYHEDAYLSHKLYDNKGPKRLESPFCGFQQTREHKKKLALSAVVYATGRELSSFIQLQESLKIFYNQDPLTLYVVVPSSELTAFNQISDPSLTILLSEEQVVPHHVDRLSLTHYGASKGSNYTEVPPFIIRQLIQFGMHSLVKTEFYVLLEPHYVAVRPMVFSDFVKAGKGVVHNPTVFQDGRLRKAHWQMAANILSVSIENPNFGSVPLVLSRQLVQNLLVFLEKRFRYKRGEWARLLVRSIVSWDLLTLYQTFIETSNLFDDYHILCNDLIFPVSHLRFQNPKDVVDALFTQSRVLFAQMDESVNNEKSNENDMPLMKYIDENIHKSSRIRIPKNIIPFSESQEYIRSAIASSGGLNPSFHPYKDRTIYLPREGLGALQAYVTFIADDWYALGALVMAHSLRFNGAKRKLIVLVTESVSDKAISALQAVYDEVRRGDHIPNPNMDPSFRNKYNPDLSRMYPLWRPSPYHGVLYTKLSIWNFTEFSKVVYLDSDLIILKPIGELFLRPTLTAAPDLMPPDTLNSGVMVIEPDEEFYEYLLKRKLNTASYNGGDQGFINSIYFNWFQLPNVHRLPYSYNTQTKMREIDPAAWVKIIEDIRILHYSPTKPWRDVDCVDPKFKELHQLWWQVFQLFYSSLSSSNRIAVDSLLHKLNLNITLHHKQNVHTYTAKISDRQISL